VRRRDYTPEFNEQVLRECQGVGNVAVIARWHNISDQDMTYSNYDGFSFRKGEV
jgi:transposase-like protein